MVTIRNYTDTACELSMAKNRLNLLLDKKEKLYSKYFPLTSKLDENKTDGSPQIKDNMADYLHELNEIDLGTGMSLNDELIYQQEIVRSLDNCMKDMDRCLSKHSGISYQLFYEIVFNGTNISKAVEKIAEVNDKDVRTIWKNYYRKIKKDVKKIANFQKVQ